MARQVRQTLPATRDALSILGAQVAAARRELGWTAAELAGRLGISSALVSRIEAGHPSVQVGTMFDAAVLCGVPLFAADPSELSRMAEFERNRVSLLPRRVRRQRLDLSDDF